MDALERTLLPPRQFHLIWTGFDGVKAVGAPSARTSTFNGFLRLHQPVRTCNFFSTRSYSLSLSSMDALEGTLLRPHQFHLSWTSFD
jgi:hypothetical protein